MPKNQRCHQCGAGVLPTHVVSGLYCSTECRELHEFALESVRQQLLDAGFISSPDAPNVFTLDGVSITEEEALHVGIEIVLERHQKAVRSQVSS